MSFLPSQTAVADFGLAVSRKWTGQDGQQKEETCFVDCRCFGKQAETLNKYCKKGSPLFIDGRLTLDQWNDKEGNKRSKHRITIESFQFLANGQGKIEGTKVNEMPEEAQDSDIPF